MAVKRGQCFTVPSGEACPQVQATGLHPADNGRPSGAGRPGEGSAQDEQKAA